MNPLELTKGPDNITVAEAFDEYSPAPAEEAVIGPFIVIVPAVEAFIAYRFPLFPPTEPVTVRFPDDITTPALFTLFPPITFPVMFNVPPVTFIP